VCLGGAQPVEGALADQIAFLLGSHRQAPCRRWRHRVGGQGDVAGVERGEFADAQAGVEQQPADRAVTGQRPPLGGP
jgi:hypothetical protein